MGITEKIKAFALAEAGFDLVGISDPTLPEIHERALAKWVNRGFAGSMSYMSRDEKKRGRPQEIFPKARSVISLAVNYYHPQDPKPQDAAVGKVAKYAYGADYHKVIEKKLKRLVKFIEVEAGAHGRAPLYIKSYVDTGPLLERAFAQQAGLGFFGKNTNLITRDYGSWVFLASLITDLELEHDKPQAGRCGSCRLCIEACPTSALLDDTSLDAGRCISYLTIENRSEFLPPGQIGEWVFGCDVCQEVCPHNCRAKTTRHPEFYPEKKAGTWLDLKKVQSIKEDGEFQKAFQGSPLKRAKLSGLLRNASAVLGNLTD